MRTGNDNASSTIRLATTGQLVDLQASHGANAYLVQSSRVENLSFFGSDLTSANAIRKKETKKKKLNASDRQTLFCIYDKILCLAEYSDPRLFRQLVPEIEISAMFKHFVDIYQPKTTDPSWINPGYLLKHDYASLACIFALFKHPVPVVILFEEKVLLECLSAVMVARQGQLPPAKFAEAVIIMMNNIIDCSMSRFDKRMDITKDLQEIGSNWIPGKILRCTLTVKRG
ncbi:MAG: hypothetical protein SGBAC_008427 [Bacillariaceae sp.]